MKIIKLNEVKSFENPHHVDARKLYDKECGQIIHIKLKPGEKLLRHITPVDVAFYVLQGRV